MVGALRAARARATSGRRGARRGLHTCFVFLFCVCARVRTACHGRERRERHVAVAPRVISRAPPRPPARKAPRSPPAPISPPSPAESASSPVAPLAPRVSSRSSRHSKGDAPKRPPARRSFPPASRMPHPPARHLHPQLSHAEARSTRSKRRAFLCCTSARPASHRPRRLPGESAERPVPRLSTTYLDERWQQATYHACPCGRDHAPPTPLHTPTTRRAGAPAHGAGGTRRHRHMRAPEAGEWKESDRHTR